MKLNMKQALEDTPMPDLLACFLWAHAESNGMEFVSDSQLRHALNVIMSTMDDRGMDLVQIDE